MHSLTKLCIMSRVKKLCFVAQIIFALLLINGGCASTVEPPKSTEISFEVSELSHCSEKEINKLSSCTNSNLLNEDLNLTEEPLPGNTSEHDAFVDFEVSRRLKLLVKCNDKQLTMQRLQHGKYWVIRNIVRGEISRNVGCADTITYTTHGDYQYLKYLLPLIKRWRAPISFALFTPGYDLFDAIEVVQFVRNCFPESELIRKFVSFHIYFPAAHMPPFSPANEKHVTNWFYNCYDVKKVDKLESYISTQKLLYPINVGRNIARGAANTHFILSSDSELLPSANLAKEFLKMIVTVPEIYTTEKYKRVFTLPIFEVHKYASIPESKKTLVEMFKDNRAAPFHCKLTANCLEFPNQTEWTKASSDVDLHVFTVAKRYGTYRYWEPIFISDNQEPMFDERITWEGQDSQDTKRVQNYAMCLIGYEYHVLNPAFLVHSTDIQSICKSKQNIKKESRVSAAIIEKEILPEYEKMFGENTDCCL